VYLNVQGDFLKKHIGHLEGEPWYTGKRCAV